MKLLCKGLALLMLLGGASVVFAQGKLTLRVSDQFPPAHFVYDSIKFWMAEVEKAAGGAVKFDYFPGEQLGKAKDQLALIQSGVVDVSLVVPSYTSDKMPLSAVAELPGMVDPKTSCAGSLAYTRLAQAGIFAKQEYDSAGVRMIWGFAYPPYQLMMAQRPLTSLKDVEGAKIRTLGSSMDVLVRHLKGVPVRIPLPDVYEALSRGTIDGLMYTHAGMYAYKMEGLIKSATASGSFGSAVGGYSISEKRWKELPAPIQKAMMDAGEKATRHLCARMDKDAQEAFEKLKQRGVAMASFSPADQQELEKIYALTANEWVAGMDKRGKPGGEALKAFREAVAQAR